MQYHYRFQLISTCSSMSAYYSTPLIDDETRCLPASKKLLICIYSHSYHPGKDCETPNQRPVVAFSRVCAWSFTQCAHKNRAVTWRTNRAARQPGGCQCVRVCKHNTHSVGLAKWMSIQVGSGSLTWAQLTRNADHRSISHFLNVVPDREKYSSNRTGLTMQLLGRQVTK